MLPYDMLITYQPTTFNSLHHSFYAYITSWLNVHTDLYVLLPLEYVLFKYQADYSDLKVLKFQMIPYDVLIWYQPKTVSSPHHSFYALLNLDGLLRLKVP